MLLDAIATIQQMIAFERYDKLSSPVEIYVRRLLRQLQNDSGVILGLILQLSQPVALLLQNDPTSIKAPSWSLRLVYTNVMDVDLQKSVGDRGVRMASVYKRYAHLSMCPPLRHKKSIQQSCCTLRFRSI
jgi:hypothetical protein